MTVKHAAAALNVSPDTIYRWIHSGILRAYQPGGRRCALTIPVSAVRQLRRRPASKTPHAV